MQMYIRPFQVVEESSQTLAVTAASQALTLPAAVGTRTVRITTNGSQVVFFRYNAAAAVATSTPVLPNSVETFLIPQDATTINFIASAVGTTVYITIGEGS